MEAREKYLPLMLVGLFAFGIVWVGGGLVLSIILRLKRGKPIFPKPPPEAVFLETWTSARNLSGRGISRRAGATNCLLVALTTGRFRLVPHFPFNLLFMPEKLGLELDLPHGDVLEVTETIGEHGITVHLRYLNEARTEENMELLLRRQKDFIEAARAMNLGGIAQSPPPLDPAAFEAAALLPLGEALRRYWKNLIGVLLFPFVAFFAFEIWRTAALWGIAPMFFVSGFLALRPVVKRRAPQSFWFVAMGVWMASGFGAMIALEVFRWLKS